MLLISLGAMLLTYIWRFQSIFSPLAILQVTALASLGAYGMYLLDRDPRRRLSRLKSPIIYLVCAILALMVFSIPGSLWPGGSAGFIYRHFIKTFILTILLAASIRSFADVERLAAVTAVGATVYATKVIMQSFVDPSFRTRGLGGYDPNDYSMLLICSIPLIVYFVAVAKSRLLRLAAAVAVVVVTGAIARGGSRAAFVGFVIVGVYLLIVFRALPKRVRIGAVVVSIAGLSFLASDEYWERMRTLLNPQEDYNWSGRSYGGRMEIWKRGVSYMLRRPLLGVGVGRFGTAEGRLSERAQGPDFGTGIRWVSPHNSFVEIGAELGVTGLLTFLALIGISVRAMWRIIRAPPGGGGRSSPQAAMAQALIGTLLGYVVVGFFLSQAYSTYLYATFGIVAGYAKLSPPKRRRRPDRRPTAAPAERQPMAMPPAGVAYPYSSDPGTE
ncbi:MAG: O-antigen ligase family protein [Gemmatimonadota bacterium]|nr:MAG: O-antigen ligase family protein [Gemmatimonadota bacterium]